MLPVTNDDLSRSRFGNRNRKSRLLRFAGGGRYADMPKSFDFAASRSGKAVFQIGLFAFCALQRSYMNMDAKLTAWCFRRNFDLYGIRPVKKWLQENTRLAAWIVEVISISGILLVVEAFAEAHVEFIKQSELTRRFASI